MLAFYRKIVFYTIIAMLFAVFALPVQATHPLGNDTTALIGGDVTDPTDGITAGSAVEAGFAAATWLSATSGAKTFYSGEGPCGMFSNVIGGGNNKWYDSSATAAYIALEFPSPFTLTHFTLAAGNDSFNSRHPREWKILGSNDGINWNDVYVHSGDAPFTGANQVYMFSSFSDQTLASSGLNAAQQKTVTDKLGAVTYTADTFQNDTAYSWYKLAVSATSGNGGAQLGELELFGYTTQSYVKTKGGSSPFPNAAFHMDASDTASVTLDNGRVSAWGDTNGKSLSFNQSNPGRYPMLSTMEINGKDFPAVKFTGTGTALTDLNAALTLSEASNVKTVFLVNEVDTYHGLGGIIGTGEGGQGGAHGDYGIRMDGGAGAAYWQKGTNNFGQSGGYRYNGNELTGSYNSDYSLYEPNILTGTSTTAMTNNITIGGYFYNDINALRPFDGKIAEVIAFSETLDATEVKIVETYLGDKYGLTIAGARAYETGSFTGQQFFVGKTANWDVNNAGAGGFGIATVTDPAVPFDLFGTALPSLTEGTLLMVSASTDAPFGTTGATIGGENYDMWEKEWYIDVTNPTSADDALFLAFNAADAMYSGSIDETWELLFSDNRTDYSVLAGTGSLENGTLSFSLGLDDLASGYYSIGAQSSNSVPEPATWVLMALGLLAGWRVARRRKG